MQPFNTSDQPHCYDFLGKNKEDDYADDNASHGMDNDNDYDYDCDSDGTGEKFVDSSERRHASGTGSNDNNALVEIDGSNEEDKEDSVNNNKRTAK